MLFNFPKYLHTCFVSFDFAVTKMYYVLRKGAFVKSCDKALNRLYMALLMEIFEPTL